MGLMYQRFETTTRRHQPQEPEIAAAADVEWAGAVRVIERLASKAWAVNMPKPLSANC